MYIYIKSIKNEYYNSYLHRRFLYRQSLWWLGGVVIVNKDNIWCISDNCDNTTNNRMELTAVIEALTFINDGSVYEIYTDSQLTLNCAIGKWKRKANLDLWKQFDDEYKHKQVEWKWVKAHNGDEYNEMVDKIAYKEALTLKTIE